ncbi:MAG: alpha/beta fold hydrolase [Acidimicrobiales bacterium]
MAGRPPRRRLLGTSVAVALLAVVGALLAGCSSDPKPVAGETTIRSGGVPVHAIVRGPSPAKAKGTVLFLHGQAYTSKIWADRKIMDAVADAGWRAVAIDLPGYGDTPKRPDDDGSGSAASLAGDSAWLKGLIDDLGGPGDVVVVSPSMSGRFSLPMLQDNPQMAMRGFVPVAPLGMDELARPNDAIGIPTLVVFGAKDPIYTKERAQHLLLSMHGGSTSSIEVIPGASHAAYDDHPKEFTKALLAFLANRT